jgi:hypothetical protein
MILNRATACSAKFWFICHMGMGIERPRAAGRGGENSKLTSLGFNGLPMQPNAHVMLHKMSDWPFGPSHLPLSDLPGN